MSESREYKIKGTVFVYVCVSVLCNDNLVEVA